MNLVKKIILSLFLILFLFLDVFCQWEQTNGPRAENLNCFERKDSMLMIGTWNGFYISTNNGLEWEHKLSNLNRIHALIAKDSTILAGAAFDGIHKSTDNGETWTYSSSGLADQYCMDFYINNDTILAGLKDEVYYSINNGDTWIPSTGINWKYACQFTKFDQNIFVATHYDGIYKSVDGGLNWNKVLSYTGTYYSKIGSNSTSIIAISDTNKVQKSDDGGVSWQTIQINLDSTYYECLYVKDSNIYIGTRRKGIYYSPDNGQNWSEINNGLTQFYIQSIYSDSMGLYAGTYSGFFYSSDNGLNWNNYNNGFKHVSVDNLEIDYPNIYTSGDYGLNKSEDNGGTWTQIYNNMEPSSYYPEFEKSGNNLYCINYGNGFYFSSDNGDNWELRNNGLPCKGLRKIAKSGSNIFIVSDSCGVYRSSDEGLNWTFAGNGLPLNCHPYLLEANDTVIYISFQYAYSDLYRSFDQGQTWSNTNMPVNMMDIQDSVIIVNSEASLKVSVNNGLNWSTYNTGIPDLTYSPGYRDIACIATNGTDFFLGTSTNGIYKLENSTWLPINAGYPFIGNCNVYDIESNDSVVYIGEIYGGVWKRNISDIVINEYRGNVYKDDNNNGNPDIGEVPVSNIMINARMSNTYTTTDSLGDYIIHTNVLFDTLQAINYNLYANVNPPIYEVAQADTGKDFGFYYLPNINDLRVELTSMTDPNPGFDNYIYITYSNVGTTVMNGEVRMKCDTNLTYYYANPSPDNIINDTLIWWFNNLDILESRNIIITCNVPVTVPLGSFLSSEAKVLPIIGDTVPTDNIDCMREIVVGSYDPNDKKVEPAEGITPNHISNNENLEYLIRFQNTGTDTATFIRIIDTLDQNLYIPSFHVIAASHPYTYSISGHGVIDFFFDQIMLPDSNSNELESHGFIKYAIEAKQNLQIGDSIENKAYIYFDYNVPIITNTTLTEVIDPTYINEKIKSGTDNILLFPNPTNDYFKVVGNNIIKIEIFNELGGLILMTSMKENIDLKNQSKGIYLIKITTKDFIYTKRLIKL